MKLRAPITVGFLALTALALAGCKGPSAAGASNAPAAEKMTIGVATVHQQTLTRTAEAQGALFPKEKAVLASEVTGNVAQVMADLGDQVQPDQILLRIDAREYALQVESAKAQLAQAEAR